ncbi:MAG TPA: TonB-dependent receptor [Puia sp.]|nr:TonB-dependent receptor [Puia sp.]
MTTILVLSACLTASANGVAQKVTLSESHVRIQKVFREIRKQTGYVFFYDAGVLQEAKPVSITVKDASVEEVLRQIFRGQPLDFSIERKSVTIVQKEIREKPVEAAIPDQPSNTITGTVKDEKGNPLAGVSVMLSGTSKGTTTGATGSFTIEADPGQVLEFSFVGFQKKSVRIGQGNILDVVMAIDIRMSNEVVIVGYGTTRKRDLTGAVSVISNKATENVPAMRADQLLQGQAAGVQITSVSGAPGSGTTIRIRGGNSISASNEPLYVIDGLIGADITQINPQDIASITILKDASATAIYGARGANGVILITTKSGKIGQDVIRLEAYAGIQQVPKLIPMMNGKQYAELANASSLDNGGPVLYDPDTVGAGTNWQKEITKTAPIQSYTVSASGGKQDFSYFLSGGMMNQDGVIINSGYKRYQFRANVSAHLKKNVKAGILLNVVKSTTNNNTILLGGRDYANSALAYSPIAPVYNPDGSFSSRKPNDPQIYDNPVAQGLLPINETDVTDVLGNAFVEWTLVKGLVFKSTFGSNMDLNKLSTYNPSTLPTVAAGGIGGAASIASTNLLMWLNENTLTWDKTIHKDHHLNLVMGTSYQTSTTEGLNANASNYSTDLYTYNNLGATAQSTFRIGSGYSQLNIMSFLARLNYSYADKYLLTFSGRSDGSSNFAENKKRAFFPSAAIAWNMSNERFMEGVNAFSNLKLRASYGINGNQAIAPYSSLASLSTASNYLIGGANVLGYTTARVANNNLKWETTGQLDVGLEFGLWQGRINVTADYYNKKTKDLLLDQAIPSQTGFTTKTGNIGSVSNRGYELTINSTNISGKDFRWETSFNISANKNKVLDLGGATGIDLTKSGFGSYQVISRLIVGQPVGIFWGATYMGTQKTDKVPAGSVNPKATTRPGDILYKDFDGDGKLTIADYGITGYSMPKFFGGIGNSFSYKGLSLYVFFQYSYGNKVMNIGDMFYSSSDPRTNQYAKMAGRWTASNPHSNIPGINSLDYIPSSRWVYDGSFLRLKTLTLSYDLTGKSLHAGWIQKLSVYVSGTNLLLWTKYPYYDPETNYFGQNSTLMGFDFTNYPQNRTVVLGVNLAL